MTGIIGGISTAKFIQLVIPLPPLAEQHRIVAKVDELMILCDQLEQQQADHQTTHQTLVETLLNGLVESAKNQAKSELNNQQSTADYFNQLIAEHFDTLFTTEQSIDQLKQTILQLAVMGKLSTSKDSDTPVMENIEEIRKEKQKLGMSKKEEEIFYSEYKQAKLNVIENKINLRARFFCDFITKGTTPSQQELLPEGEVPFLKVYNIVNNQLDFNYKPIFISKEVHQSKLKRSVVFPNDVIMNIVGPPLGKVAIITNEYPEWNMNQALAVFRPLCGIYNQYIYYMLSSELVLKPVLREVKGTAGQDNLSLEQCRNLLFPIPSKQEQYRVVAIITKLLTLCDSLKANLNQAQTTQTQLADALVKQAVR
jgi:type I restriction enzyme S subunit